MGDILDEINKIRRKIRKLSPRQQEALGRLAGELVGNKANQLYESSSEEDKILWRKQLPFHHGDIGCALVDDGKKRKDYLRVGLGKGLMISDIADKDEWVYPQIASLTKRNVAKKRRKGSGSSSRKSP
jgi:hypothetical protein